MNTLKKLDRDVDMQIALIETGGSPNIACERLGVSRMTVSKYLQRVRAEQSMTPQTREMPVFYVDLVRKALKGKAAIIPEALCQQINEKTNAGLTPTAVARVISRVCSFDDKRRVAVREERPGHEDFVRALRDACRRIGVDSGCDWTAALFLLTRESQIVLTLPGDMDRGLARRLLDAEDAQFRAEIEARRERGRANELAAGGTPYVARKAVDADQRENEWPAVRARMLAAGLEDDVSPIDDTIYRDETGDFGDEPCVQGA